MAKRQIIGLGTGRCGTHSLATLLGCQESAWATHEGMRLPWAFDKMRFEEYLTWITSRGEEQFQIDVGLYLLPYADEILARLSECRIVVIERPRDEVVASFERWVPDMNHWQEHWGREWKLDAWDISFPKYTAESRAKAIELYWEEYRMRANALIQRWPARVLKIQVNHLNNPACVSSLLRFCGFSVPKIEILRTNCRRDNPITAADEDHVLPFCFHCPHGVPDPIRRRFFEELCPQILGVSTGAVNMELITVVTYNSRAAPCLVERQADRLNFPHFRVLAREVEKWTWLEKITQPLNAIQIGRVTTPYIFVIDGDDVLFTRNCDGSAMIEKFLALNADLVFCPTSADWPADSELATFEIRVNPNQRSPHLSAGCIFGKTAAFARHASNILSRHERGDHRECCRNGQFDDQRAWRWQHRRCFPRLRIDVGQHLFARFDAFTLSRHPDFSGPL